MPISPADVIAGTLRRAGVRNAELHAKAIAADLAGHSLLAETSPRRTRTAAGPAPKCARPDDPHSGTELIGGRCPICQWSPTT